LNISFVFSFFSLIAAGFVDFCGDFFFGGFSIDSGTGSPFVLVMTLTALSLYFFRYATGIANTRFMYLE
jgi:hypothetical protein